MGYRGRGRVVSVLSEVGQLVTCTYSLPLGHLGANLTYHWRFLHAYCSSHFHPARASDHEARPRALPVLGVPSFS